MLQDIVIKKETIIKISLILNVVLLSALLYALLSGPALGVVDVVGNRAVRELVIQSDDGSCSLTIAAQRNSVGMWLNKKGDKNYVYMFAGPGPSPYVALGDGTGSDPLAFYLNGGKPTVQLKQGNVWDAFDFADLLKSTNPKPIGKVADEKPRGALPPVK